MMTNTLNKGHFTPMMMVKKSFCGKNRSFVNKDGMFRIYEHMANCYSNRKVQEDDVGTMALGM